MEWKKKELGGVLKDLHVDLCQSETELQSGCGVLLIITNPTAAWTLGEWDLIVVLFENIFYLWDIMVTLSVDLTICWEWTLYFRHTW